MILERIKQNCFIKNNFTGYEIEDPSSRIAASKASDEQCDRVTRISIIRNKVLSQNSKAGVLDFLLSYTDEPIVFEIVKKIYIRDMIKGSEWTIIEWFFKKDHSHAHRKAFGRTLVHVAYTLWRKYKKIVLYFDAIQKCGGHRSTDIQIENIKATNQ